MRSANCCTEATYNFVKTLFAVPISSICKMKMFSDVIIIVIFLDKCVEQVSISDYLN
jgi:hypothetical protein